MTFPLLRLLRSGPPPPKVVLLPDSMFFTRSLLVVGGATQADVSAQVELALETLSPFSPAQLYHGFFWTPGADRVLVFAAYRRRFSADQVAEWENAELVMPAFAALLGGEVKPETTLLAPSADGLTAVYWDSGAVPARVAFRPVDAEASEEDRLRVRDELLGGEQARGAVMLGSQAVAEPSPNEREFVFSAEAYRSRLALATANALDVRDKAELAALRGARRRDLVLWRSFLGLTALLGLLGVAELLLVGHALWQKTRVARADAQRPVVERIMAAQSLTTRINELSTKRLLPFEMIALVTERKPSTVTFTRTATNGLHALVIDAYATSPDAVSSYQAALNALPVLEKVEVRDQRTRDNTMTFSLTVTFKPGAVKPAGTAP